LDWPALRLTINSVIHLDSYLFPFIVRLDEWASRADKLGIVAEWRLLIGVAQCDSEEADSRRIDDMP
jgi:hypothetical protein